MASTSNHQRVLASRATCPRLSLYAHARLIISGWRKSEGNVGFISDVNVIVRGRSVVMPTPSPSPFFQRSPRPFKFFRARVNGEGLGSGLLNTPKEHHDLS